MQKARADRNFPPLRRIRLGSRCYYEPVVVDAIVEALVLTGLRVNELRSLTCGQLDLEGPAPVAILRAADEKS